MEDRGKVEQSHSKKVGCSQKDRDDYMKARIDKKSGNKEKRR
jgi:hypothetical protein